MKNTLKMMKKLFVCVFLWSFFLLLLLIWASNFEMLEHIIPLLILASTNSWYKTKYKFCQLYFLKRRNYMLKVAKVAQFYSCTLAIGGGGTSELHYELFLFLKIIFSLNRRLKEESSSHGFVLIKILLKSFILPWTRCATFSSTC